MGESNLKRKLFARMRSRTETLTDSSGLGSISDSPAIESSISSPNLLREQSQNSTDNIFKNKQPMFKRSRKTKLKALFLFRRHNNNNNNNNSADSDLRSRNSVQSRSSDWVSSIRVPHFIVPQMNALKLPIVCHIRSLEGELMREVFVHRYELGQFLIESLKVSLGIDDSKYFGLKQAKSLDDQEDVRNPWLDLNVSVCKQIKSSKEASTSGLRAIDFYLRIKYYPPNLGRVQDPFLRNYLWLQLRRDLRLGKLTSSINSLTSLMSYVIQYELGDYQPELTERLQDLNILPNQDLIEEQAIQIWKSRLVGTQRHQAQMQFLRAAVILETYGFDYYPVRDHQRQRAYLLGFNYAGVKTVRNGRISHHFRWHSISKISYERRMIIFHIYPNENSKRKQILGFKCLSIDDCQNLYMRLLEQKYFFMVDLAYFDKSIQRPTCLYATSTGMQDWSSPANPDDPSSQRVFCSSNEIAELTNCQQADLSTMRKIHHQHQPNGDLDNSELDLEAASSHQARMIESSSVTKESCSNSAQPDQLAANSDGSLRCTFRRSVFSRLRRQQPTVECTLDGHHQVDQHLYNTPWTSEHESLIQASRALSQDPTENSHYHPSIRNDHNTSVSAGWLTKVTSSLVESQMVCRVRESLDYLAGTKFDGSLYSSAPQEGCSRVITPILRFCLMIMLTSFTLKIVNNLSNALMDLLTFGPQTSSTNDSST